MKITKKGEYALKAILALAMVYGQKPLTLKEIARKEKLPFKFLEQIMSLLKKNALVISTQGKYGGYVLARAPKEITLGEAIRSIEGPLAPIMTAKEIKKKIQQDERHAGLFAALLDVRNAIADILDTKTLADICQKSEELKQAKSKYQMYYI